MLSIGEKIVNGLKIFKDKFLIFVVLSLISSILSIAFAPELIKNNIPEKDIESQLSISFGGIGSITDTVC
jgi:predicted Abi (CAAX) family protease